MVKAHKDNSSKFLILGVLVLCVILVLCLGVGMFVMSNGPSPTPTPTPTPTPKPKSKKKNTDSSGGGSGGSNGAAAAVPAKKDPPVENNQAWRDDNPGAVIATVSPSCATPKTFDPNVKYKGPSGDNYYNYCHEMVLSQTPSCKVELCKNENVYGACKNECQ
jgi:hypothetical protein